jgi:hypothetical protein
MSLFFWGLVIRDWLIRVFGNCLVVTRYSGFGTRNLDILCLKSSKTPIIAFRIPNSQSRLSNYGFLIKAAAPRNICRKTPKILQKRYSVPKYEPYFGTLYLPIDFSSVFCIYYGALHRYFFYKKTLIG